SEVVATAVMVFIVVQATIAALNELGLTTLSEPLTGMMGQFWNLLPKVAVGVVIVVVAVFVGQLLRRLVSGALRNIGLDRFMETLGFKPLSEREDRLGEYSEMLGFAVQVGVILLGVAQALTTLELVMWSAYVNAFLGYIIKNVAVATFVVGIGFAIGNYVRDLIRARGEDEVGKWMGEFARYAVLVFAFTMAVRQLDVAEDFVLLTFGLLFGALCLGAALAFGLGGREVAGDIVKRRYNEARKQMTKRDGVAAPTAAPRPPAAPVKPPVVSGKDK
ncbi:MAG: mechanosensitive ion channel, partial [Nannocystaceae bacterium]|nr:mechanosensitive ion channel [Nannocystaceae bacterium]